MPARLWLFALPLLLLAACAERPADVPSPPAPPELQSRFDPSTCGTIHGTVRWQGEPPRAEPFRALAEPLNDQPQPPARDWPNPNVPRVDPTSRGLADAVVLLRGVDPQRARPWNHPPVHVELRRQAFSLSQGESNVGFVRVGDAVDFVSHDDCPHAAQARGAAFFALPLPQPARAVTRRLTSPGVVELASGCGYFWMRGYLHVSDHPYLTRTDAAGNFRLEQVPAGDYEVVAWHPDWRVRSENRNPDLLRVQQVRFGPPLESSRRVSVRPGQIAKAELTLKADASAD